MYHLIQKYYVTHICFAFAFVLRQVTRPLAGLEQDARFIKVQMVHVGVQNEGRLRENEIEIDGDFSKKLSFLLS
jgi:hypothetical protein